MLLGDFAAAQKRSIMAHEERLLKSWLMAAPRTRSSTSAVDQSVMGKYNQIYFNGISLATFQHRVAHIILALI